MSDRIVGRLSRLACLLALASSASLCPTFASDSMTLGSEMYAKGEYALARKHFQRVSTSQPNSWLPYYHLANCDVKLSDLARAEQEYRKCSQLSKDPEIINTCTVAIKSIAEHRKKIPAKVEQAKNADDEFKRAQLAVKLVEQAGANFQKRRDDALAKRERIIEEGKKQAQAVRVRAQAEIAHLADNGNWICQNSKTGAISATIPTRVADEISEHAEEEAARVMRDYENRAAGVFIPDYDNTVHHLLGGLTDKSKHGPKLSHHGTNMYVRTYTHSAPAHSAKKHDGKLIAGSQSQGNPTK